MTGDDNLGAYSIFQERWWWDATALTGWDEVTIRQGDKVHGRWPFVRRHIPAIGTVIGMPPLTKWAGPWIAPQTCKQANRYTRAGKILEQLLEQLPQFSRCSTDVHPDLDYWLPLYWRGFDIESRVTYAIVDCSSLDCVEQQLDQNTRWQIKKAQKTLSAIDISVSQLIDVAQQTYKRKNMRMRVNPEVIESVVSAGTARNVVRAVGIADGSGQVHAVALFVWDDRSLYYLIGGGDPALRSSGAGSLAVWEGIRHAGALGVAFDFEGSMIRPVERFFRGFGAVQRVYVHACAQTPLMRILVNVAKRRRK